MKVCNRCNNKRGGLQRFAIVEDNILKLLFMCSDCRIRIRDAKIPSISVPKENVDIKAIIQQMNVEYEKLKKAKE